jgi:hypothetical protein
MLMTVHNLIIGVGAKELVPSIWQLGAVAPLYIGPDQILPLVSVLGAAVGVLLIIWHRVVALGRKLWQFAAKRAGGTGLPDAARKTIVRADGSPGRQKMDSAC